MTPKAAGPAQKDDSLDDEALPQRRSGRYADFVERLSFAFRRWRLGGPAQFRTSAEVLDHYVASLASHQNAIDAVPGWVGAMPPETGLRAGIVPVYADERIAWLLRDGYPVAGKTVLELSPGEGFHTYMLHRAGAASIEGVESNALAFVRCLVTKEVLGLDRARFVLGDVAKRLAHDSARFDLVVAANVRGDPVELVDLIAAKADAIFFRARSFDAAASEGHGGTRGAIRTREVQGIAVRLQESHDGDAPDDNGVDRCRLVRVERSDLLRLLDALGFTRVAIAEDDPQHADDPDLWVFAERMKLDDPEAVHVEAVHVEPVHVEPPPVEAAHAVVSQPEVSPPDSGGPEHADVDENGPKPPSEHDQTVAETTPPPVRHS